MFYFMLSTDQCYHPAACPASKTSIHARLPGFNLSLPTTTFGAQPGRRKLPLHPLSHHHHHHHHHHQPSLKTSKRARFRGWLIFATTNHPRKRASSLVFNGGCSFLPPPPPPPATTLENEHVRSFSKAVALSYPHHCGTTTNLPRKRANELVFEGGCSFLPPPPLSSIENEHVRSFLRMD